MAEIRTPKTFSFLSALSSIDGRFRGKVEFLSGCFSEQAIYKRRVLVEIEWLLILSKYKVIRRFTGVEKTQLRNITKNFSDQDARHIWEIDEKINHDTKAIELFLSEKFKKTSLSDIISYIHFGLTSTDVDNLAFSLCLEDFLQNIFYPFSNKLLFGLKELAKEYSLTPMLARTHGVPALPTTAGKEFITGSIDFKNELLLLKSLKLSGKVSGAVGNRNELNVAFPYLNWRKITEEFIESFALTAQDYTTQIETHTDEINMFSVWSQLCRIGAKISQDMWIYNSLGYLALRDSNNHVGSSVMPHKINPIGFELAQTYFTTARDTFYSISNIIADNRMQRDLRDKYALRKIGEACAEMILAIDGLTTALSRIGFNQERLKADLEAHWEILSAPLQTLLRTQGIENAYDMVKKFSRGEVWNEKDYKEFILTLPVSKSLRKRIDQLSPGTYFGEAVILTKQGIKELEQYLYKNE